MARIDVTIGSDPELFTVGAPSDALASLGWDRDLTTSTIPAFFSLGLEQPDQMITLPQGTLRPDGLAAEFTVTPAHTPSQIVEFIRQNIRATAEIAQRTMGCRLSVNPRAWVDPRFIAALPESFGKSCSLQMLGCDPDFSVYNMDLPDKPDPKVHQYRTSGGHIHLFVGQGFAADQGAVSYLTALLDRTIGAAGTYLCASPEAYKRKEQYGYPGMIRVPTRADGSLLGTVEYRTLPAQALVQTPELARLMFTVAQECARYMTDIFYDADDAADAYTDFGHIVGSFRDAYQFAEVIARHDVTLCREDQARWMDENSSLVSILSPLSELQSYRAHEDFELYGW